MTRAPARIVAHQAAAAVDLRRRTSRLIMLRWPVLALVIALWPLAVVAEIDPRGAKSQYFMARCFAALFDDEYPNVSGLRESYYESMAGNERDWDGFAYSGQNVRVKLIVHDHRHCGINVSDEGPGDMAEFLAYWLERDQSPFVLVKNVTMTNGDQRIEYEAQCSECASGVFVDGYWDKDRRFSVYRVFRAVLVVE